MTEVHSTPAEARNTNERSWARWGGAAGALGVLAWLAGTAMIPPTARLASGAAELSGLLAAASSRLYVAALLAVAGGVLIVALFAALTQLACAGRPGSGLLRVALAGCIITQTLVAVGGIAALLGINAASVGLNPDLVSFCWRALWMSFVASGVPTLLFTVTGVLGLARAGLAASWVTGLGWISAAAHVLVLFAMGEQGLFALDGPIGMLTPVTTDIWILTLCATLPKRVQRRG